MQNYVLGFMFRNDRAGVVLIRKLRPKWQAGLLNGIGGHIIGNETAERAMVREFKEETGVETTQKYWNLFARLSGDGFKVQCFYSFDRYAYDEAKTVTDEQIEKCHPNLNGLTYISNLPWLLAMAMDPQTNFIAEIIYR